MRKQSILYKTLCRALSIKRPHEGKGVAKFTKWIKDNVPAHLRASTDKVGNIHIDARRGDSSRTLFVAHVDTVHRADGPNKFIKAHGMWYAKGAPLGADDGAGCAMLMHLLHAGVPGYYVFTQGEECGGIGAKYLAKQHEHLLSEFDRAIAFDRRGIDSVITHQGWGRCCSDTFADALSAALNVDERLMYLPDSTGVYTDTAEFTDIIPECTNISVGYDHEHSDKESLNIYHFMALADRVIDIDWDSLPTSRDPSVVEGKWDTVSHGAWATTSVSSFVNNDFGYAEYSDEELELHDLTDAIYDAQCGYPGWLIEMMCESVYPEDPELAQRFVDKRKICDEALLKQALGWTRTLDAATALAMLFDSVYREHA
jgi:hypothetical protein